MVAGTTTMRTRLASSSTATARPRPSSLISRLSSSLMAELDARNRVEIAMWAYETDRMKRP
jgi:hypothetical protein